MCIKAVVVVGIFSEQLSVGLRSSITARRAKLLLVHSNVFHIILPFFSVLCTSILCQKITQT